MADKLVAGLEGAEILTGETGVGNLLAEGWRRFDGFVCIMAAGIVVRAVAPLLADKEKDPCVVVVDELGCHAVSLLSGHLGGGNDLARKIAGLTGGKAVVTTASDVLGLTALDIWAREQRLVVADRSLLTRASAHLICRGEITVYSEVAGPLPPDFRRVDEAGAARLVISCKTGFAVDVLQMYPPQLVVGIGCNRDTGAEEIDRAMRELFTRYGLARASVDKLASIDLKSNEPGLLAFAGRHDLPVVFFNKQQLNMAPGLTSSAAAMKAIGVKGVAEPAALLAARTDQLIIRKEKWKNVTLAVAAADFTLSAPGPAISIT